MRRKQAYLAKDLSRALTYQGYAERLRNSHTLHNHPLAYLYLYHVVAGDRQVFALFSTAKEQAHVVMLQKSRDANQDLPNTCKDICGHEGQKTARSGWRTLAELLRLPGEAPIYHEAGYDETKSSARDRGFGEEITQR